MLSCTNTINFNEYYDFVFKTSKCFALCFFLLTLYPNVSQENFSCACREFFYFVVFIHEQKEVKKYKEVTGADRKCLFDYCSSVDDDN